MASEGEKSDVVFHKGEGRTEVQSGFISPYHRLRVAVVGDVFIGEKNRLTKSSKRNRKTKTSKYNFVKKIW